MNSDTIYTHTVGNHFAEVKNEFTLSETATTRTVFQAEMHPGGVRGFLFRYKKKNNGDNEEIAPTDFRQLHENEGVCIELKTEAVNSLMQEITRLQCLINERGVENGNNSYTVTNSDAIVISDKNKAKIIRELLEKNLGEEVWRHLSSLNPELATKLAISQIQQNRAESLRVFEKMLADESLSESSWQKFFETNTWIFGYGLHYQILRVIQAQPNYGGTSVTGTGGQRGDFLTATSADVAKFTCLVEIKKPTTLLLQKSEYRNGTWRVSNELAGAVSQIHVNCAEWEIEGSRTDQNRELLSGYSTISPRGIVIIGNTSQLDDRSEKNSFERFRQEIRNPEIITYDELYHRASFILGEID